MGNLIIWAHQSTVDYNYGVGEDISSWAGKIVAKKLLKEGEVLFERVRDSGLHEDRKLTVTDFKKAEHDLKKIRNMLEEENINPDIQIGGDPAISAIRGHLLRLGPTSTELPEVWYAGLYPKSVEDVLNKNQVNEAQEIAENVFREKLREDVKKSPQSVGLEADVNKLILIYGRGRSISKLAPDGTFEDYFKKIEEGLNCEKPAKKRIVIAVNAGKPEPKKVKNDVFSVLDQIAKDAFEKDLYNKMVNSDTGEVSELVFLLKLLRDVRERDFNNNKVRTFVATRDFRKPTGEVDMVFTRGVLRLLEEADIVSSNDTEIHDLHTAFRKEYRRDPLAYKLKELPFKAIKVCHSADGVIMDLGCRPEKIITSQRFQEKPAVFLEEVLRLSADGATYAMDATAGLGRSANEAMIRIYSRNVKNEDRQHERFRATFLQITEPIPAGMISIASARVVRTLGAIVGLGAVFDGLLLSFMMRD